MLFPDSGMVCRYGFSVISGSQSRNLFKNIAEIAAVAVSGNHCNIRYILISMPKKLFRELRAKHIYIIPHTSAVIFLKGMTDL